MTVLCTVAGAALLALTVREIFHELFHTTGRGAVSDLVLRRVFEALRASPRPGRLALAGPLGIAAILLLWGAALALGWTLLYLPHFPDGFGAGGDPAAAEGSRFLGALYFSLVTLTTLGYGDLSPVAPWLRLMAPIEALMGFALLSASITWVLTLHPVLVRKRSLAHEAHILVDGDLLTPDGLRRLGESGAAQVLLHLTSQVVTARDDFLNFPISRYFHAEDARTSLPEGMLHLQRLARAAQDGSLPEPVRTHGRLLELGVRDFAAAVAEEVLEAPAGPVDETLAAYARRHRRTDGS